MKAQPDMPHETVLACMDSRPMFVTGKAELRKYRAVFAFEAEEVSEFSDGLTDNCALRV